MQEEGYNGWKNYPTWNVALWLSNDRDLYDTTRDMIHRHATGEWPVLRAADALATWVTEELAPDLGASFAADLMGWALEQVDWREIVENYLSDTELAES